MEWIAGDIGGTKSWLAWAGEEVGGQIQWRHEHVYPSADFASVTALLHAFMADADVRARPDGLILAVPGPVHRSAARLTNLDWVVDADVLKAQLGIRDVRVVNDFEAAAAGIAGLGKEGVLVVNAASRVPGGVQVITGAGTGLGLAFVIGDANGLRTYATEGGHIDFAPANGQQDRLLAYLRTRYGHVSWERAASGSAFPDLYAFCRGELGCAAAEGAHDGAWVASAAGAGDPAAEAALDMFVQIYGAWVGNLALLYEPYGGLYIAGGVSLPLQSRLLSDAFITAALDKGRMRPVVEATPVFLVTSGRLGVEGALALRRAKRPAVVQ